MTYIVGVDIGGTFTDLAVQDEATGEVRVMKVPSTPTDQSVGLLRGLEALELEAKRIGLELFEENPDGKAWFMLSMSLWHVGEKAEARRLFDESVAWQEEHLPDSPLLKRQRQEAAELLGLQP